MFGRRVSNGMRERPLAMSSASATRTMPASIVIGSPARRCPITAWSASGDHDGQLRVLVDPVEQQRHPVRGEEEAVLLVVGAVDRHAGVVEQARGRDHHLGVADVHAVLGDHRRLDAAAVQQPEQPQRDVDHDLDVDPGVVRHVAAVGVDLLHVPPGVEAPVARSRPRTGAPACGSRAWERESRSSARPREVPFHTVTTRTTRRRPRPRDLGPPGVRHGPLQLPLPVLHAGRRPAVARPRRGAALRGDRAAGVA